MTRRKFLRILKDGTKLAVISSTLGPPLSCARKTKRKRRTYIINLDGMPADYLFSKDKGGNPVMPNLTSIVKEGMLFTKCYSNLPAVTICNHSSIVTGASTGPVGVYGAGKFYAGLNEVGEAIMSFYAPDDIQAKTLFEITKEHVKNAVTAVIVGKGWVGEAFNSPYCDIMVAGYSHPDYIEPPKGYMLGGTAQSTSCIPKIYVNTPGVTEFMEGSISIPGFDADYFPSDEWILESTKKVIETVDPDFLYILFAGPDDSGHVYGNFLEPKISTINNTDAMIGQMRITDKCVGEFISFLKDTGRFDDTIIVITADHGMGSVGMDEKLVGDGCQITDITALLDKESKWVVDIRKILNDAGFKMKASDMKNPYNPSGLYEYSVAEGPHAYIFGIESGYANKIAEALEDYNRNRPDSPIEAIVYGDDLVNGVNKVTGFKYSLYNEKSVKGKSRVKWPDMFVFLKRNYTFPIYMDAIKNATVGFMKKFQIDLDADVAMIPGVHGSFAEQHVPLVILGKGIPAGVVEEKVVSTLQILPTIAKLNGWQIPEAATYLPLL